MKQRIYKYDNVKALLIFLVVVGHLTSDYVTDYHSIRWFTLWIYTFHMPAFIFISGLMHKRYISEEQAALGANGYTKFRADKFFGLLFTAYGMKLFIYLFRLAIGQRAVFSFFVEPGAPWYLIVMAEYEVLLFLIRKVNWKAMLPIAFAISAVIGYFPAVGDFLSLSRMFNFFPIFLVGYYMDTDKLTEFCEKAQFKIGAWIVIIASIAICYFGPWKMYAMRKWFTGRRSYEFMQDFFPGTMSIAWAIRLGVWLLAIMFALSIIIIMPNKQIPGVTVVGERSLSIYFWHRPIAYWICGMGVYPALVNLMGGSHTLGLIIYVLIALAMTELFSLKIFIHPAKDLTKLGATIMNRKKEA